MNGEETGFTDKQGKPIHYGDIVQIGLGISDRVQKRVIHGAKGARLTNVAETDGTNGGYKLTAEQAKLAVILDHQHQPFEP